MSAPPQASREERIEQAARLLAQYMQGEDRYVRAARGLFGCRLGATQERILRAIANRRRVLIVSGNGVGKSYAVALAILSFLYTNPGSTAMLTSGSYSLLADTTWKPMKTLFRRAQEQANLPGRAVGGEGGSPPRLHTEIDEEWYFKAVSPTHPENLEGRHAADILVVIEEADKPDITDQHFESAGSSITDANDRLVAVANPPEDESNVVYEKMQSDRWHVVNFSSFDSHNVLIDAGELDAEPIEGIVDLPTIAEDYEAWNGMDWPKVPDKPFSVGDTDYDGWPGVTELIEAVEHGRMARSTLIDLLRPGIERARQMSDGLDTRWYRRRLGVMPPDDATVPRPWTVSDVEDAERRWSTTDDPWRRDALAADIARGGGDRTAVAEISGPALYIGATARKVDHTENENLIGDRIDASPLDGSIAIDAVGEGSAVADTIRRRYAEHTVRRFNAGASADDDDNYHDARSEALQMLGDFLKDGGVVRPGSELANELKQHARHCQFEEKPLRAATVYQATPKSDIKDAIGHSPDLVDAAMMAAWAHGGFGLGRTVVGTFGSEYDT